MNFFENTHPIKRKQCFVVMPYASEHNVVFSAIEAALKVDFDTIPHLAEEIVAGDCVMEDVLLNLADADLVIADISGNNANVFYELGIAHIVRSAQPVLLITQNITDMHLDLKSFRCIEYTLSKEGLGQLKDKLVRFVKEEFLPTRFVFKSMEGDVCLK